MSLTPRGDRIVAKPIIGDTTTAGGVVLPENAVEETLRATVLAVGPADEVNDLAPGDVIVHAKYGGTRLKDEDGAEILLLRDADVIAKVA